MLQLVIFDRKAMKYDPLHSLVLNQSKVDLIEIHNLVLDIQPVIFDICNSQNWIIDFDSVGFCVVQVSKVKCILFK